MDSRSPSEPAPPRRVALIAARWHSDIVDRAVDAFCREMAYGGDVAVDVTYVPGAFEIPFRAQRLARSKRYAAIAACAFVVDGGIYRHDFVAQTVVQALMRIQLDEQLPVLSAVLTPHAFHSHDEHTVFFATHFATKGQELAAAVIETVSGEWAPAR